MSPWMVILVSRFGLEIIIPSISIVVSITYILVSTATLGWNIMVRSTTEFSIES